MTCGFIFGNGQKQPMRDAPIRLGRATTRFRLWLCLRRRLAWAPHSPPQPSSARACPPAMRCKWPFRKPTVCRMPRRPVRPIHQPLQPSRLIPGQPGMQTLPRHSNRRRCLGDRPTVLDHREHCLIALLRHTQLPHTGVSRINRNRCQPSSGTPTNINRNPKVNDQAEQYREFVGPVVSRFTT